MCYILYLIFRAHAQKMCPCTMTKNTYSSECAWTKKKWITSFIGTEVKILRLFKIIKIFNLMLQIIIFAPKWALLSIEKLWKAMICRWNYSKIVFVFQPTCWISWWKVKLFSTNEVKKPHWPCKLVLSVSWYKVSNSYIFKKFIPSAY